MRICFFNSTKFWGGGEKWHLEAAEALRNRGHECFILTNPQSELMQRAAHIGLEVLPFKIGKLSFLNPVKVHEISRALAAQKIDAIIFNGSNDLKIGALAAKKAQIGKIIYRRGTALPVKGSYLNKRIFKHYLTHIIANSQQTKRFLLQNMEGVIPPEKITVIYNGLDTSKFTPAKEIATNPKMVIGNIGRFVPQKAQHLLIELGKELKNRNVGFEILIGGDGGLKADLQKAILEASLEEEIKLVGFVADVPKFLAKIDIFALSSYWEGFGYVMAEAMAMKKPVVAFEVSSNPEIVANGETGYLVPPGDVEQMADRIEALYSDKQKYRELAQNARKRVERLFEQQQQVSALENLLAS